MSSLKEKLVAKRAAGQLMQVPGVYDGITALVASQYPFDALYVTGYGVSASLGMADAGLMTYTEVVERVAVIRGCTDIPLICDADTGFGGTVNINRTVRGFEAAGASAIQIEDQENPKKCGHTDGRRVVPIEEMKARISVALDARRSDHTLIIARTDARTAFGLDEAIRRGQAYREAGADIVFVESPESAAELERVAKEIDGLLMANMVIGGKTPLVDARMLEKMGFAVAIYPSLSFRSAAGALDEAYRFLHEDPHGTDFPVKFFGQDLPPGAMHRLVGFPAVWDLEARFANASGKGPL